VFAGPIIAAGCRAELLLKETPLAPSAEQMRPQREHGEERDRWLAHQLKATLVLCWLREVEFLREPTFVGCQRRNVCETP
jgi:hypothetical protein